MSIGLFDNVGKSFGFAFDNTFKKFLRWIGLTLVMCIPIVNWIATGIFLKIFRDEEPSFENAGKSFIQGFVSVIISLIYSLIPLGIVAMLTVGLSLLPALTTIISPNDAVSVNPGSAMVDGIVVGGFALGLILTIVVSLAFSLVMQPALINYARKQSFGAAFAFGEIFGMIGKLGWGKYILAWIVLFVIAFIYSLVIGIVSIIPILGLIVTLLSIPFLSIFIYKYFSNLFE